MATIACARRPHSCGFPSRRYDVAERHTPYSCHVPKGKTSDHRTMITHEYDRGYSVASPTQGTILITSFRATVKTNPFIQKETGSDRRPCQCLAMYEDKLFRAKPKRYSSPFETIIFGRLRYAYSAMPTIVVPISEMTLLPSLEPKVDTRKSPANVCRAN